MKSKMGHAVGEAAAFVGAFPPFAALVAEVADLAEVLADGGDAVDVGDEFFALFIVVRSAAFPDGARGIVAGDAVLVGVKSGGEGGQGGTAQGGRQVAAAESGAARFQFIDVRRLDDIMADEAVVGPGVVIGQQQDDVGSFGGTDKQRREKRGGAEQGQAEESREGVSVPFDHGTNVRCARALSK